MVVSKLDANYIKNEMTKLYFKNGVWRVYLLKHDISQSLPLFLVDCKRFVVRITLVISMLQSIFLNLLL